MVSLRQALDKPTNTGICAEISARHAGTKLTLVGADDEVTRAGLMYLEATWIQHDLEAVSAPRPGDSLAPQLINVF
jgi:hypothetical protein